jgi:endonuclease/exonuclease/phosphatase (EEP) superfamily protein YafD
MTLSDSGVAIDIRAGILTADVGHPGDAETIGSPVQLNSKCDDRQWRSTSWGISRALANFTCAATVLGFLARWWFPFEYACHFRAQYAVVLIGGALLASCSRRFGIATIWASFAMVNLCLILPLYFGFPTASPAGANLRLVSLNLMAENLEFGDVRRFITEKDPDVVVLVEVNRRWVAEMDHLSGNYPYTADAGTDTDNGILILSRHPICQTDVKSIHGRQAIVVRLDVMDQPLTLVGAHTWPPKTSRNINDRNKQLAALAEIVRSIDGPVLLAGDLNTSSWSPAFDDLVSRSGLRDSRQGFGLQPTWPAGLPLVRIPIDHCLVSHSIVVQNREVGRNVGSDHFPIVVDFSIDGGPAYDQFDQHSRR